jgi:hypothetical protein
MVPPKTHTPASFCSMMGACAKTNTEHVNLSPLQTVSKVDLSKPPIMSETTGGWPLS